MALSPEHEKYHKMGPQDVGLVTEKKPVATIDVARTTNHTGEQFHVACPVYADDSRDTLKDRVQFFLSIIQDRLEEENKAMIEMNEKNQKIRNVQALVKKNALHFQSELKKLKKKAQKEKWSNDKWIKERSIMVKDLKEANEKLVASLEPVDRTGISTDEPLVEETEQATQ